MAESAHALIDTLSKAMWIRRRGYRAIPNQGQPYPGEIVLLLLLRKIDFLCGWPVSACAMEDQSHEQTHSGRADPAQPQLEEGQIAVSEANDSGDNRGLRNGLGQRLHEIEEAAASVKPVTHRYTTVSWPYRFPSSASRIRVMASGNRNISTGREMAMMALRPMLVTSREKNTEADGPETVFRPIGEHGGEGFGTAGDQTDGGLETRQDHRQCQHHQPGPPQIVLSNDSEGLAAVGAGNGKGVAPGPHDGDGHIDAAHEQAAENAGEHRIFGDSAGLRDAQPRMTLMTTIPKARLARASMVL